MQLGTCASQTRALNKISQKSVSVNGGWGAHFEERLKRTNWGTNHRLRIQGIYQGFEKFPRAGTGIIGRRTSGCFGELRQFDLVNGGLPVYQDADTIFRGAGEGPRVREGT